MATPRTVMVGGYTGGIWSHGEWITGDYLVDPDGNPIGGGTGGLWFDHTTHIAPLAGALEKVVVGQIIAPQDANAMMQVSGGNFQIGGTWNGGHLVMGIAPDDYHFWVDTDGLLRSKKGAPLGPLEGDLVGMQSL